jgi:hypothetical protein
MTTQPSKTRLFYCRSIWRLSTVGHQITTTADKNFHHPIHFKTWFNARLKIDVETHFENEMAWPSGLLRAAGLPSQSVAIGAKKNDSSGPIGRPSRLLLVKFYFGVVTALEAYSFERSKTPA